jgi:two-component system response regulator ChvI
MSVLENERDRVPPTSSFDFTKEEADRASHTSHIRALLIDDDDDYREAATAELEYFGFEVAAYRSGEEMFAYLDQDDWRCDVIVLDWRLQTGPAISLLPELRSRGIELPIVFLTGSPSTANENEALDHGAVDFVDKARGIPILAKRLRLIAHLNKRPAAHAGPEPVVCGKLLLRPDIGRAYWDGVDVQLTLTEFRIVHMLASQADGFVTYRTVYDSVHHAGFVAGNGDDGFRTNVRSSIRRIRNKFRELDDGFSEIENYPSFGYRWRGAAAKSRGGLYAELIEAKASATA